MDNLQQAPAWARAREWFTGGYGHEPDLTDETDVHLFLEMLTQLIREDINAEIATYFRKLTAQLRERMDEGGA